MKKSIYVSCILIGIFSITAFSFVNHAKHSQRENATCVKQDASPDHTGDPLNFINQILIEKPELIQEETFFYEVDSRFRQTITKSNLQKATSIYDIYPEEATHDKKAFNENKLVFLADGGNKSAYGDGVDLTEEQKQLLQTMDYSDNFYLHTDCTYEIGESGYTSEEYIVYYVTIIPEKEAEYKSGYSSLMNYIKAQSKGYIQDLNMKLLKAGKIAFEISPEGNMSTVYLEHTCGYPEVDQRFVEIIKTLPGSWSPANDENGNTVPQTFVFSFGMVGC